MTKCRIDKIIFSAVLLLAGLLIAGALGVCVAVPVSLLVAKALN